MEDRSNDLVDWTAQIRRGLLELCLLALLEDTPSYGYEIVISLAQAPRLAAGEGTIYPLLRRLRKEGKLKTFWRESEAGPPRQYYQLTPVGRQALQLLRDEWVQLTQEVQRLLQPRSNSR